MLRWDTFAAWLRPAIFLGQVKYPHLLDFDFRARRRALTSFCHPAHSVQQPSVRGSAVSISPKLRASLKLQTHRRAAAAPPAFPRHIPETKMAVSGITRPLLRFWVGLKGDTKLRFVVLTLFSFRWFPSSLSPREERSRSPVSLLPSGINPHPTSKAS